MATQVIDSCSDLMFYLLSVCVCMCVCVCIRLCVRARVSVSHQSLNLWLAVKLGEERSSAL